MSIRPSLSRVRLVNSEASLRKTFGPRILALVRRPLAALANTHPRRYDRGYLRADSGNLPRRPRATLPPPPSTIVPHRHRTDPSFHHPPLRQVPCPAAPQILRRKLEPYVAYEGFAKTSQRDSCFDQSFRGITKRCLRPPNATRHLRRANADGLCRA